MRVVDIKGTNGVMATVIYGDEDAPSFTRFVTSDQNSIQVGILNRPIGTFIKSHKHLPVKKTVSGCQEVLIVKKGSVTIELYDEVMNHVQQIQIGTGDIFIQYYGGHSFYFNNDTQFIEIKQGPYTPADKVFFNPLAHEQTK